MDKKKSSNLEVRNRTSGSAVVPTANLPIFQSSISFGKETIEETASRLKVPVEELKKSRAIARLREDIRSSSIPQGSTWGYKDEASRLRHIGSLPERMKYYAEIPTEELDKISEKVGVKQVPKKIINQVTLNKTKIYKKNIDVKTKIGVTPPTPRLKTRIPIRTPVMKRIPSERITVGGDVSSLPSSIPNIVSKISKVKSIISKSLPIVSKIASHPVAKVAGRILEAGALGASAYDVGKSGLELYSEVKRLANRPTKLSGKLGTKVPLPKIQSSTEHEYKSFVKSNYPTVKLQAELNAEAGAKLRGTPNWQKTNQSSNLEVRNRTSGSAVVPTANLPILKSSISTGGGKRPLALKANKPKIATSSSTIPNHSVQGTGLVKQPPVAKRPSEIREDLSFLPPLQIPMEKRISPVRPIATRVLMPEQFGFPSMKLATLPKINRYKLGVMK